MDKTFTYQELRKFNGKNGQPIYVAYNGLIYDVTASDLWKTGRHQNRHDSGDDLSTVFASAPHGVEVFDHVPVVGKLV